MTATNTAPIASNVTPSVNEDGTLNASVTAATSDVDNNINPNGYSLTDNVLHGTITFNTNGSYTYTPTANFNGIDSVHYQVCDLGMPIYCSTATIIITVNSVNDKPLAVDDAVSTQKNTAVNGTVATNDSDVDGNLDANSFVKITNPLHGTITFNANGSYTYTPNNNFVGLDSISYKVCDL